MGDSGASPKRLGKLPVAAAFVEQLDEHIRAEGFKPLPIALPHALAARRLSGPTRILSIAC